MLGNRLYVVQAKDGKCIDETENSSEQHKVTQKIRQLTGQKDQLQSSGGEETQEPVDTSADLQLPSNGPNGPTVTSQGYTDN